MHGHWEGDFFKVLGLWLRSSGGSNVKASVYNVETGFDPWVGSSLRRETYNHLLPRESWLDGEPGNHAGSCKELDTTSHGVSSSYFYGEGDQLQGKPVQTEF